MIRPENLPTGAAARVLFVLVLKFDPPFGVCAFGTVIAIHAGSPLQFRVKLGSQSEHVFRSLFMKYRGERGILLHCLAFGAWRLNHLSMQLVADQQREQSVKGCCDNTAFERSLCRR